MKNYCLTIIVLVLLGCTVAVSGQQGAQRIGKLTVPTPPKEHSEALLKARQSALIAMTILGEARGEGLAGMYAVACVISQRSINRKMTPMEVCLQNRIVRGKRVYQFSCWNASDKNRKKLEALLKRDEAVYAKYLAENINRLKRDYVKNADHYCTLKTNPYWADGKEPTVIIKNHKFYKLKR